jgi:hypothetical protein
VEFEQKGICRSEGYSQHFATGKADILKIYLDDFDVAQIAVFKVAIFKTCLLERGGSKVTVGEGTGIVFSCKNIRGAEILKMLFAKIGHLLG